MAKVFGWPVFAWTHQLSELLSHQACAWTGTRGFSFAVPFASAKRAAEVSMNMWDIDTDPVLQDLNATCNQTTTSTITHTSMIVGARMGSSTQLHNQQQHECVGAEEMLFKQPIRRKATNNGLFLDNTVDGSNSGTGRKVPPAQQIISNGGDVSFSISRRKQLARTELVLDHDDHDDDLLEQEPVVVRQVQFGDMNDAKKIDSLDLTSRSGRLANLQTKADDEFGAPEIVCSVNNHSKDTELTTRIPIKVAPSVKIDKTADVKSNKNSTLQGYVHYLVRDYLIQHQHEDVVALLDREKSMPIQTSEVELKQLHLELIGLDPAEQGRGLLEQFLISWDEKTHGKRINGTSETSSSKHRQSNTESKSSKKSSKDKKSSGGSSITRKKPVLNVITTSESSASHDESHSSSTVHDDHVEVDYNRLNHPGSTPKPVAALAAVLGEPGSTPKASARDLRVLGFDDVDTDEIVPSENMTSGASQENASADMELSDYALRKRHARKHRKHVSVGEPGRTPTKEYIFFRETPPQFVTETVEEAMEVYEKLGNDPVYVAQTAAQHLQERFVELQSSEVSKYKIGQEVQGLGAQRNVSGVVSKIYGTRQCGTSGPGTIIIDTCPDHVCGEAEAT